MLHSKEIYAEFPGVPAESIDLVARYFVLHGQMLVDGGNVMIGGGKRFPGTKDFNASASETFKGLGACHFMDVMHVDIQNIGTAGYGLNHMGIPDFVKECPWFHPG